MPMAINPQETAEAAKVLIAYRQLSEMLKDGGVRASTVGTNIESYNRFLETLTQCFGVDQASHDAVRHLKELGGSAEPPIALANQMASDGKVLLATAHSFVEIYLSPEDKKKVFGFHPSE